MRYSVQPRDRIFLKGYGFCLDQAKTSATNAFTTASKRLIQKTAEATVDFIKLLIEFQMSQKLQNRIIQKQLQMNMIKKYLKKDIYLQKRNRKQPMI